MELISHSPAETESLGETWGREAQRGLVIALSGDLGAGKTQLVRGVARGLGYPGRVRSPTFALVNIYEGGRLPLFHLDLYRLESLEAVYRAGMDEYLQPDGVAVIEWAERLLPASGVPNTQHATRNTHFARHTRFVKLEVLDDHRRRITYEDPRL